MRRVNTRSSRGFSDSSSSSSDSGYSGNSSNDSDDSGSDACAAPVRRRPANKLERLRRIFLSQPSTREPRVQRLSSAASSPSRAARSLGSPDRPRRARRSSSVASRRHFVADHDEDKPHDEDDEVNSSTDEEPTPQQVRLSVDSHVHSLCEQVKRMTTQRESTASQLHTMLDQAIEELQFLKRQEERSLQCHIKQIEEDFALRLEVFEQHYLAKVAEIQREMQTAIQQQRVNAEATILAAAKQLREKTQLVSLPAPSSSILGSAASLGRQSVSIRAGAAALPPNLRSRVSEDDFRSLSLSFGRKLSISARKTPKDWHGDGDTDSELSPVEKQKAKLRALEARLASFSQNSVERIAAELKGGGGSGLRNRSTVRAPETVNAPLEHQQAIGQASGTWKPTPLSPLRKNRSYWRKGISLEAEHDHSVAAADTTNGWTALQGEPARTKREPALSSRFLLPEEELELRRLRNSIGLAKDWMERHR